MDISRYKHSYKKKRLVLFVGPHKSASTSIQNFFIENAANYHGEARQPEFENWTWPFAPFAKHPGAFADLVTNWVRQGQSYHDERRAELYFTAHFVWQYSPNVVLGHEEFDRVGYTPFSNRDGLQAIRNLIKFLQPPNLDVVINYRTPRSSHWISIWKQLAKGKSYDSFICRVSKPWEYLNSVSNPLGIASSLLADGIRNVTLIDMGGVDHKKLDISHVMACEILRVNCIDGWVKGIGRTVWRMNTRSDDPGLTTSQIEDMEWLLRQRDCSYRFELAPYLRDDSLKILYNNSLWDHCEDFNLDIQGELQNTSFILRLLQAQVGCKGAENTPNVSALRSSASQHRPKSIYVNGSAKNITPIQSRTNHSILMSITNDQNQEKDLAEFVILQHVLIMVVFATTICHGRRLVCRYSTIRGNKKINTTK